jgi:hypothetical protein
MVEKIIKLLETEMTEGEKQLFEVNNRLKLLSKIPNDEWDLEGDAVKGESNKKSAMDALVYEKAFTTGEVDKIEHIINVLKMTEVDFKMYEDTLEEVRSGRQNMINNRPAPAMEAIPNHQDWCPLKGTDQPWGISEGCICQGAYIIRKKMKEGLTFDESKQYIIDNG